MPGKFMKGALVEFMPTVLVPLPNVIIFQFNPETIRHVWTQPEAAGDAQSQNHNPLAVRGMPGESFSFTLVMDANDQIAEGNPIAKATGIASRLAALEMLMYPTGAAGGGLLGSVSASVSVSAGGVGASLGGSAASAATRQVPQSEVPTVLFVWGPGRIVPVRVTGLSIEEKLYDELLNPTHAEAQLELRVLTPEELARVSGPLKDVAKAAYTYSQVLRQGLAVANLANSVESIVGMLPL
ncbi:hypothetical protein F0U61_20420 [Archangium violaceum]|uniref:hypothetical protein n=1 Tax=Archangium violaceum TaxID=83451 RepID=UPI002B307A59|nr:hypothetical protein F0U61_20420 [Archangium violaceum]